MMTLSSQSPLSFEEQKLCMIVMVIERILAILQLRGMFHSRNKGRAIASLNSGLQENELNKQLNKELYSS